MSSKGNYPGVTAPLSLKEPTERELELTDSLVATLQAHGAYESADKTRRRQELLKHLENLSRSAIVFVCENKGLPKSMCKNPGGKLFTYGSYELGVHGTDSDIDTLCVLPAMVQSHEYFEVMENLLKNNEHVTSLNYVHDAYVPVIKFVYDDIPIDLVCAELHLPTVPLDIEVNDSTLNQCKNDISIRSLNGTRVARDILDLVPDIDTFRTSLRCIKLWANCSGIDSNVLGFPGGVAWAILVVRICQLYPRACASVIIGKFFNILITWSWPSPVILKNIGDGPPLHSSTLKPWNNRINPVDRSHLMPIITPSYPNMCTTHNVTSSTFRIIKGELKAGRDIVNQILEGNEGWSALFNNRDVLGMYHHYIRIVVLSTNTMDLCKWSGFVEAKLRQLVIKLGKVPHIALVHPFTTSKKSSNDSHSNEFYLGLYIKYKKDTPLNGRPRERIVNLTQQIREFSTLCKSWHGFNPKSMNIVIQGLENKSLNL